jgi:hypothetical protein
MARGRDPGRPEGGLFPGFVLLGLAVVAVGSLAAPPQRTLHRDQGAPPGSAVEASGPGNVTASVGRPRPLAFTLEAFSLR